MEKQLFNQVLAFDLDGQMSEYTFSIRLAKENNWTRHFTKEAIIEYKKFMYLAATAGAMVSPSEIVDIVWHQHLIFTKSYQDFCKLLGKKIEHIPSTHNRAEASKFREAKERTTQLYQEHFGEQPADIWNGMGMYDSLGLEKASMKSGDFILFGTLFFMVLSLLGHFLLPSFYTQIQGLTFLGGYSLLVIVTFLGLYLYNRHHLNSFFNDLNKDAFIFRLSGLELVFLKMKNLQQVIHGVVNQAIVKGKIKIEHDHQMSIVKGKVADNLDEFQVLDTLNALKTTHYPAFLKQLVRKPLFVNIENTMKDLQNYFASSKIFANLFRFNFIITTFILMLGVARLSIGVTREKPVGILIVLMVVVLGVAIGFLINLKTTMISNRLMKFYKTEVAERKVAKKNSNPIDYWEWNYFLNDSTIFAASFIPIVGYVAKNGVNSTSAACGSCGSSCGSGCGSGCGGGCGGCGG